MKFLVCNGDYIHIGSIVNTNITLKPFIRIKGCTYFDVCDRNIYAISEQGITVFSITDNANIVFQDASMKIKPSHISYTPKHKLIFASNYHLGYLRVYRASNKGVFQVKTIVYPMGSKIHQALHNPYNDLLYVTDLGLDKVYVYEIKGYVLNLVKTLDFPPKSGPRHLTFRAGYVFVLTEYSNQVFQFNNDFELITAYDTLNTPHKPALSSAIRFCPSKDWLYTLNRQENYLTSFKIVDNQFLKLTQIVPTNGDHARDFNVSFDGKYILVANMLSNNLTLFDGAQNGNLKIVTTTPYKKGTMLMFIK